MKQSLSWRSALLHCLIATLAATQVGSDAGPAPTSRRAALPAGVERREVVIFSDGVRMAGDLYLPSERVPAMKHSAVVLCAGTAGTKGGSGARLGPLLAQAGYVALAFDYRGWGESDSKLITVDPQPRPDANGNVQVTARAVRWQMDFADQAMDIRAAISFVAGEPRVDQGRIGIWGSSYGGGLVTWTAGNDPRVKCVVAQVPGLGARSAQAVARAFDLLTKQARGETEPVPFETGRMTGQMARYTQMRVNPSKSLGYNPTAAAETITAPALFVVAENEELSSNAAVEGVHRRLRERGVPTRLHVIKGIGHYGIYREGFDEATRVELEWFSTHLQPARTAPSQPLQSQASPR